MKRHIIIAAQLILAVILTVGVMLLSHFVGIS